MLFAPGAEVYQSFPETGNMGKVLPRYLSQWTMRQLEKVKVKTRPETKVIGVECKGDRYAFASLPCSCGEFPP